MQMCTTRIIQYGRGCDHTAFSEFLDLNSELTYYLLDGYIPRSLLLMNGEISRKFDHFRSELSSDYDMFN